MRPIPLVLLILVPIIIPGGSLAEATAGRSTACTGTLMHLRDHGEQPRFWGEGHLPGGRMDEVGTPAPTPWTSSDGD